MDQSVLFAIVSMFLFGVNMVLLKTAKGTDSVVLTAISVSTAALMIAGYWLFFHGQKELSQQGTGIGILSGLIYAVSIVLLVTALKYGKASIVAPINALGAGVAVLLAVFFLSEKLTLVQIIGIILAIAGVILIAL